MRRYQVRTLLVLILGLFLIITGCKKKTEQNNKKVVKVGAILPLKIGAILPLTGGLSFLGEPGKNAIEMLKPELSKNNVKVILYDSKGDAKTGLTVFRKATEMDKVKMVLTTLTNVSLAIKPVAKQNNILQVIIAIYPDIAARAKYALQFCYNAVNETKAIKSYILSKKVKKVFFFGSKDAITNLQIKQYLIPWLKEKGIEFEVEWFDIGTKDFKPLVAKFGASGAQLGVLLGYGSDFQGILREIATQNLTDKIPLIGGIGYLELPQYVRYKLVKNSVFVSPEFLISKAGSKKFQSFRKAYKKAFGKEPTYDAAYTYDAIWTLLQAIKHTHSTDVDTIVKYIISNNSLEGVTGPIRFDQNGTLKVKVALARYNENMDIVPANK